jgi:hypothetical protein
MGPETGPTGYRSTPLEPEVFTVASREDGGFGIPLWLLPVAGVVLAGAGLLRADCAERILQRAVYLGHGAQVDHRQHPFHQSVLGKDDDELQLALSEAFGQLEEQAHADAVDVGSVG